ncbi:hypothetical protein ACIRBX_26695 [Kitasatospora sp. NPDC096147]|uniref:hypothetical protein n=1 Tax=Kitasatospora sp. NPDC096147 TaxID=3364093 RepID=UPI00380572F1
MSRRAALATAAALAALSLTACVPEEAGPTAGAPSSAAVTPAPTPSAAPSTSPGTPSATPSAAATKTAKPSPTGPRKVVEASIAGGLALAVGPDTLTDVPVDPGEMRDGMQFVQAEYDRPGKSAARHILVLAVDNVPEDPNKRREHLWRGLIDYALQTGSTGAPTTAEPYAPGPLGGSLECLSLPAGTTPTDVICGWADATTAGVALIPATTPTEAARLFAAIRADVEK